MQYSYIVSMGLTTKRRTIMARMRYDVIAVNQNNQNFLLGRFESLVEAQAAVASAGRGYIWDAFTDNVVNGVL